MPEPTQSLEDVICDALESALRQALPARVGAISARYIAAEIAERCTPTVAAAVHDWQHPSIP